MRNSAELRLSVRNLNWHHHGFRSKRLSANSGGSRKLPRSRTRSIFSRFVSTIQLFPETIGGKLLLDESIPGRPANKWIRRKPFFSFQLIRQKLFGLNYRPKYWIASCFISGFEPWHCLELIASMMTSKPCKFKLLNTFLGKISLVCRLNLRMWKQCFLKLNRDTNLGSLEVVIPMFPSTLYPQEVLYYDHWTIPSVLIGTSWDQWDQLRFGLISTAI